MADDIQIKSTQAGSQPVSSGAAGTGQAASGFSGSTQPIVPPPPPQTESQPVIDLRNMSLNDAQASAAAVTQAAEATQPAAPTSAPAANAAPAAQSTPAAAPQPASAMQSFNLEEAALSASTQTVAGPPEKYTVPDMVKQKFPDLIQLIKDTESMNDEERDYWFQILPIMTEDQIAKFRDILLNEKAQLSKLDKEYETELTKLNEKHMIEWKEFESKEKRKAISAAETASQQQEQATEEDLLKRLSNV